MILAQARSRPREARRYACLPAWVWWANVISDVIGWTLFGMIMSNREIGFLLGVMPGGAVVGLHFLLVFLPTLNRVLFAERIAPLERLIALAMACAGPTGILLGVVFWP